MKFKYYSVPINFPTGLKKNNSIIELIEDRMAIAKLTMEVHVDALIWEWNNRSRGQRLRWAKFRYYRSKKK